MSCTQLDDIKLVQMYKDEIPSARSAKIFKAMNLADQWIWEGKHLCLTRDQIIELALKKIR
jgi:hypothetical protein